MTSSPSAITPPASSNPDDTAEGTEHEEQSGPLEPLLIGGEEVA